MCYSGSRIDGASVARYQELQREVSELSDAEDKLDELINKCSLQLRLLTEDSENKIYPSCLCVCVCYGTCLPGADILKHLYTQHITINHISSYHTCRDDRDQNTLCAISSLTLCHDGVREVSGPAQHRGPSGSDRHRDPSPTRDADDRHRAQ